MPSSIAKLSLALLAILFALPVAAQAVPPQTPALIATNPVSPGISATPRVQGYADGVSPQVVDATKAKDAAIVWAANPASTITIYADDPTCSDGSAVVGAGPSLEFENSGIEVSPVKTDAVTTFYAAQSDLGGSSECSAGFPYRQVTGAPAAPTLLSVSPMSPADDNSPHLIGDAPAESTVSVFSNPSCSGTAIASGTAQELAGDGIQVSVPDNSTTTFYATASWAVYVSACSTSSISYQELSLPPGEEPPAGESPNPPPVPPPPAEGPAAPAAAAGQGALPAPHLRTMPAGRANDNNPIVVGTAPGAAAVRVYDNADCTGIPLAKGSAAQLGAGFPIEVGDNTTTSLYGVAFNSAGRPSSCSSAPAVYIEDSTPPLTRITLGPAVKTRVRKPVFRFTDTTEETGTAFFCRIDKGVWKPCETPWHAPRLRGKSHVVRIRAIDAAGNAEPMGARLRFQLVAGRRR